MAKIKEKETKTTKPVKQAMNVTERELEVARDRGFSTNELLANEIVPFPILFDDDVFTTKPDKSSLICELEENLTKGDNTRPITYVLLNFLC